jgi:DNA-binding beta-propeller fold protein YncE
MLFVVNQGSNSISWFRRITATGELGASAKIPTPARAVSLAIDAVGRFFYATTIGSGTESLLEFSQDGGGMLVSTLLQAQPVTVAVDPAGC